MKGDKKQKPRGMKHKIREEKKREERVGLAVTVAILIVIISISSFFIYSMLTSSPHKQETSSTSEPKAAIVDHLSLTAPNPTFIQTATNTLKQAGYTVDYYLGEKVTVEFYRNLPTHAYSLIILRVHSATDPRYGWVGFFSSELYSKTKYVYEQLTDQVTAASYNYPPSEEEPVYFGITPAFVSSSMHGRFRNTTIVMMGCDGLKYTSMAEAFIERGARVYISWSDLVLASHTDQATTHLLQNLITEKQTVKQAVDNTMKEVGPDPAYKSLLLYHPLEVAEQTVEDMTDDHATKP